MTLERVALMMQALCLKVRLMGRFWSVEVSNVELAASKLEGRSKAPAAHRNTKQAENVVLLGPLAVLHVGALRNVAQVREAIVGSIAVNVVDDSGRPLARHVQHARR